MVILSAHFDERINTHTHESLLDDFSFTSRTLSSQAKDRSVVTQTV